MAMPADIEQPVGPALTEGQESGRSGHGGRDGHDVGPALPGGEHGLVEGLRVALGVAPPLGRARRRIETGRVVQAFLIIGFGRAVPPPLLREDVHHDRSVPLRRMGQRHFHAGDVMSVDRADVAHAEGLEEGRRLDDLPDGGVEALQAAVGEVADLRDLPEGVLHAGADRPQTGVEAQLREALGETGGRRCVGAPVVVEDDDDPATAVAEVVEPFESHAPGHGTVPDHGDDAAVGGVAAGDGGGHPVGVGEDRGRVGVFHQIVDRLGA
jgi:hypothetical protein